MGHFSLIMRNMLQQWKKHISPISNLMNISIGIYFSRYKDMHSIYRYIFIPFPNWPKIPNGIFFSHYRNTRKPALRVFLAPPEGLMTFLSSLYHAWQLLLAKFFDLVKLEFWPPGPPEPPGGQGSNLNSLFPALQHEGHTLSIWFGYYERFPRSFATYGVTNIRNQRLNNY